MWLFGAAVWCQTQGPRTFELPLPENWRQRAAVLVVFENLEVPENRGVVFRLFASGQSEDQSLGSFAVLGKSREAKGRQLLKRTEVNITKGFRLWAEAAKPGSRISIHVKPYAGLREANDFTWLVKEVKLELR